MSVLADLLRHAEARAVLRSPFRTVAEKNEARAVLGLPPLTDCPDEVEP